MRDKRISLPPNEIKYLFMWEAKMCSMGNQYFSQSVMELSANA